MTFYVTLSSKGQLVIPKEVRDALGIAQGAMMALDQFGDRIVLHPRAAATDRISLAEFRKRVPRHDSDPVSFDAMNDAVDAMMRLRPSR